MRKEEEKVHVLKGCKWKRRNKISNIVERGPVEAEKEEKVELEFKQALEHVFDVVAFL